MLKLHDFCNRADQSSVGRILSVDQAQLQPVRLYRQSREQRGSRSEGSLCCVLEGFRHQGGDAVRLWSGYVENFVQRRADGRRSEEHTSELQSLMRISYAVFCLKQKTQHNSN